jgi:hypothetical protein
LCFTGASSRSSKRDRTESAKAGKNEHNDFVRETQAV